MRSVVFAHKTIPIVLPDVCGVRGLFATAYRLKNWHSEGFDIIVKCYTGEDDVSGVGKK